jgi:hypothetical protein
MYAEWIRQMMTRSLRKRDKNPFAWPFCLLFQGLFADLLANTLCNLQDLNFIFIVNLNNFSICVWTLACCTHILLESACKGSRG